MTVRLGFVSNSSSSSFVLVGIKLTDEEIKKVFPDKDSCYDVDNCDIIYDDFESAYYAGDEICGGEEALENFEISIDKIVNNEKAKVAVNLFNKNEKDIKLYGGTTSC
jgi:hypothetical protein